MFGEQQCLAPADVPRFAGLDVIANIQALWARRDREIVERKLPPLGPEREPRHFRSARCTGNFRN